MHRLYHFDLVDDILDLVGLKVADKMSVCLCEQFILFGQQLLHSVFTDVIHTRLDCVVDNGGGHGFGGGQHYDLFGVTPCPFAGFGNAALYILIVLIEPLAFQNFLIR
jgi:hypothetical protein